MSDCRDLEPLLAPYVDGVVPVHDREAVDAHLSACPPCRGRVAGERAVREVLQARRHELRAAAPEALRMRCRACAPASVTPIAGRRRVFARRIVPLSFAATLLLAVGAVFVMGLNGSVEALAMQLAADHMKCFQLAPDHATVDAARAGVEWSRSHGWLLRVPQSSPSEQLQLLDVRRCLSTQGITAHIMYKWRGAPLSVYVLNSVPKRDPRVEQLVSRLGQEAVIWSEGGRTYAVVGRGSWTDLERVARYVRTNAH